MVIRDDRLHQRRTPPGPMFAVDMGGGFIAIEYNRPLEDHLSPDAVLYDCPECGRAHFVRCGECPDAAEAAAEAGMVRRAA